MDWINYKEKSPEVEGDYLTFDKYGKIAIKYYSTYHIKNGECKDGFSKPKRNSYNIKTHHYESFTVPSVLYWMPLPTPPEGPSCEIYKLQKEIENLERRIAEIKEGQ